MVYQYLVGISVGEPEPGSVTFYRDSEPIKTSKNGNVAFLEGDVAGARTSKEINKNSSQESVLFLEGAVAESREPVKKEPGLKHW